MAFDEEVEATEAAADAASLARVAALRWRAAALLAAIRCCTSTERVVATGGLTVGWMMGGERVGD